MTNLEGAMNGDMNGDSVSEKQRHTGLTRTESRRLMIRAKRVGWEGTVGDYCTTAGLTEISHGPMVRAYLRALVEFGEAGINLTDAGVFPAGSCNSFGKVAMVIVRASPRLCGRSLATHRA